MVTGATAQHFPMDGARALVRGDSRGRVVEVTAIGPHADRLRLIKLIRVQFENLHNAIPGLEVIDDLKLVGDADAYTKVRTSKLMWVASLVADPTLAAQELGWHPTSGLNEMCEYAWRWQRNSRAETASRLCTGTAVAGDVKTPDAPGQIGSLRTGWVFSKARSD